MKDYTDYILAAYVITGVILLAMTVWTIVSHKRAVASDDQL